MQTNLSTGADISQKPQPDLEALSKQNEVDEHKRAKYITNKHYVC